MDTTFLAKWENDMNVCIRCAYCYAGCPVFDELGWESDGARGKVILAHALLTGALEPSEYIAEKLYQCSYCRDCIEQCSSKVPITDIMTAARADLFNAGFTYDSHKNLVDMIDQTGNIFGKPLEAPVQDGETPVLLGCRLLERSEDAQKYIEILKALGIKPKIVDELCCGMPYGVLGYKDALAKHMETFREQFPFKEFICLCTTCVYFIANNYPDLKPKYVINAILEKLPDAEVKKLGLKAAYHDPCNLARGMDMVKEPRDVLTTIGVDVVEFPTSGKKAECCGGGGGLLVTDRALSDKLAGKRVQQAMELGVETIATLCPTCELNLGNAANGNGGSLRVKNVLDLVYDAVVC